MGKPTKKGRFTLPIALLTAGSLIVLPLAACQPGQPTGPGAWPFMQNATQQSRQQRPETVALQFDPGLLGTDYQNMPKTAVGKPFQLLGNQGQGQGQGNSGNAGQGNQGQNQGQGKGPPVRNTGVIPRLDCVKANPDGSYTAYFGYHHSGTESVTLPIGPTNQLVGPNNNPQWTDPRDRGQPTTFEPGNTPAYPDSAFAVDFSNGTLTWLLDGHMVKASKHSMPVCSDDPNPQPSPSGTPWPIPDEVIFDPADPGSLGDLYPSVPGNADIDAPETSELHMAVNGETVSPAAIGEVLIHVAEPIQANLEAIKERYLGAALEIDGEDGYYLLKVNMRTIELMDLGEQLLALNDEIGEPEKMFHSVSLGNLESARTFALLVDLLSDERVRGAELNTYWESQSFSSYEGAANLNSLAVPAPSPAPFSVPNDVQNYWWLNAHSTRMNEAWHYNMGYDYTNDEPVQVAVIDTGFAGLSQLISNGQDLAGRVRVNQGFIDRQSFDYTELGSMHPWWCVWCSEAPVSNDPVTFYTPALMAQENTLLCDSGIDAIDCKLETFSDYDLLKRKQNDLINYPVAHGTLVTGTLAAQIGNGSGTVGAAPYVEIIPIKVGQGFGIKNSEVIHALKTIHDHPGFNKVSVVNLSLGLPPNAPITDAILSGRYGGDGTYSRLRKAVYDLWNKKVIVIFGAGNNSVDAKYNINTISGEALIAGAVQLPPAGLHTSIPSLPGTPNPQALTRSVWSSTSGSNWSPKADIFVNPENLVTVYAPGSDVLSWGIPRRFLPGTSIIVPDLINNYTQARPPFLRTWTGTSASAPILAATVALMKGLNPNLSLVDARLALIDTAYRHTYRDNHLQKPDGTVFAQDITLRILNAEAAVERIYNQNFFGSGRMQSFSGTLLSSGGKYRLQLTSNPSQIYDLQWGPFATETAVDNTYQLRIPLPIGGAHPIRNFLNQTLQVQGHLKGNRLYVHQTQTNFGGTAPSTPTGIQFENIQTNSFRVVWNPSSNATSYEVHVNGSLYQTTSNTTLTVSTFPAGSSTPLTPDTPYTVAVRAVNTSGSSPLSSPPANVRTLPLAPTPPPSCTTPIVDTVVTDSSWQWSGGAVAIVTNPWYTPQISGAWAIWSSEGPCVNCSYVFSKSYSLPSGYVKQAHVDIQANQYANVSVRGRGVGLASSSQHSAPQRFNIDPAHFGPGGNSLTLSFLAQHYNASQMPPSVTAKFTIERCP